MKLILATRNEGKTVEMQYALSHLPLEVITLNDYPHIGDIPETGNTLVENAFIKAETVFKETGIPALADDTGLEIDVLNGAPGVYSARYAGESATFEENCSKVIDELSKVAPEKRTARFRTVIAYVNKDEKLHCEGVADGMILDKKIGTNAVSYTHLTLPTIYSV